MTNSPEPQQTPAGPAYQGRLLDRPGEEVIDQGAAFDIRTVLSRRGMLGLLGAGGVAALAACTTGVGATTESAAATSGTAVGEIPEETNGPYPADGTTDLNILRQSGIERSDIRTNLGGGTPVAGVPLTFTFTLTDMAKGNVPFAGAAVYLWHCDAQGRYSMYTDGVENETWLRGIQVADDQGRVTFTTIVPGCYQGRWTHFHFEVFGDLASATDAQNAIATSQVAFPADMLEAVYADSRYPNSARNLARVGAQPADDRLFGDGDVNLQLPTMTGDVASGYAGSLPVAIDTTTAPGGGGMGGRPPR